MAQIPKNSLWKFALITMSNSGSDKYTWKKSMTEKSTWVQNYIHFILPNKVIDQRKKNTEYTRKTNKGTQKIIKIIQKHIISPS